MNKATMRNKLKNRVAIVTGGASGFGRASAILLHRNGARVVVCDCNSDGGQKTVKMILSEGGEAVFVTADVSESEDIARLIRSAVDAYTRLDILFNNAGIGGKPTSVTEISEDRWKRVMDVNLKSAWLGIKYAVPEMLRVGGGSIINLASTAGIMAMPDVPVEYSVSKAGMIMLTKAVAVEFATRNIRINCICPGHCATPMVGAAICDDEAASVEWSSRQPMGRMGTAEEVAQAVLFLACEECSSYVTGAVLAVDGGYTAAGRGVPCLR